MFNSFGQTIGMALIFLIVLFVVVTVAKSIQVVPQSRALVVERLGKFQSVRYA